MAPRFCLVQCLPVLMATAATHCWAAEAVPLPSMSFSQTYQCDDPVMPFAALRKGAAGRTEISFRVGDDGSIADVQVAASAGETREHKLLDVASLQHVRSCRYVGPKPVPAPARYKVALVWDVEE
jgi:TonB family protein